MKLQLICLFSIFSAQFVASEVCNGFETCLANVTKVNEGDKVTLLCTLRKPTATQSCIWVTPDGTYVHPNTGKNNCSLNLNDIAPYMGGMWTCVESVMGVVQKDLKNNQHSVSGKLVVKAQCYTGNGAMYAGHQTRTKTGKKCEQWTVANMKNQNAKAKEAKNYPESNITEALNYCRNPDGDKMPWCYTTDPSTRWEFCNVKHCDSNCSDDNFSTLIKGCGNYHLQCSGVIINAEKEDTATKSKGPDVKSYDPNQNCVYNMTSPYGTVIKLTSVQFQVEAKYDKLTIYDGSVKGGTILGSYTGSQNFSVVSSSNQITMMFSTDATIDDEGFRINFQVLNGCTPKDIRKCDKYNVNCRGNIYSQNYPMNYPSHSDCTYQLTSPQGSTIQLNSISFDTEKNYDNLTVYDGSEMGRVLGVYSGIRNNFSVATYTNRAVIRFRTDQGKVHQGFHIYYRVMHGGMQSTTYSPLTTTNSCEETKTSGCGVYGGCRGIIRSQHYPMNYESNTNCAYVIQGKPNSKITLTSINFNTEECCDVLTIYEGHMVHKQGAKWDAKHGTEVAKYKGRGVTINLQLTGMVTLVFQTDGAKTDAGWEILYTINPY